MIFIIRNGTEMKTAFEEVLLHIWLRQGHTRVSEVATVLYFSFLAIIATYRGLTVAIFYLNRRQTEGLIWIPPQIHCLVLGTTPRRARPYKTDVNLWSKPQNKGKNRKPHQKGTTATPRSSEDKGLLWFPKQNTAYNKQHQIMRFAW